MTSPTPKPDEPPGGRTLARWRNDRGLAHVVPLVVFQIFLLPVGWLKNNNPALPWWERAPEQWIYPIQTIVCGALLVWWWRAYRFDLPRPGVWLAAVGTGLLGIFFWILPCELHARFDWGGDGSWLRFFGLVERSQGFDPQDAPWPWAALVFRFLRMVVVVALLEEVFWRGFLMRWLADPDRPLWRVPFGTHHWRAYFGTVLLVTLIHSPQDYAAAFLWGSLIYLLAVRTKSLTACVVAHAVANLALGLYVMATGHYGFW